MKFKHCGSEVVESKDNIKIPELGIEITPLQEWKLPYNQIVIPEGYRLAEDWELIWIARHAKYDKTFFPKIGKDYYYVWCLSLPSEVGKYSRRLCLGGNLDLYSGYGGLADSSENGRVAFVRKISKKVKK